MTAPALLIEELVEATGFSRQTVREAYDTIADAVSDVSSSLRQRVRGIMASSSSLGERYDAVMEVTDENIDTHTKTRIFGALGLGFMGGLILSGAGGSLLVALVGIVLIVMAGYMLKDMIRIAMDHIRKGIEAITFF